MDPNVPFEEIDKVDLYSVRDDFLLLKNVFLYDHLEHCFFFFYCDFGIVLGSKPFEEIDDRVDLYNVRDDFLLLKNVFLYDHLEHCFFFFYCDFGMVST